MSGGREREHVNPIDATDVTHDERAAMLREYLEAFVEEFDTIPRLMPLDEQGKAPIIQGRCRLDSPEGRALLVDGEDAIVQIRNGARGFALYAGKRDHGTEEALFVDHDDPEAFSSPTGAPTLEVLSGSGRGPHETYRNGGDVENARVGENVGEIRAENWYVVVPGSIHPSGGVYHVTERRDIAALSDDDLDDSMRPATRRRREQERTAPEPENLDGEGETPDDDELTDRLQAAFDNSHDGDRIEQVYKGNYAAAGFDDRSSAEFWLANRLDSWVGLGDERLVERLMGRANLQKWPERTDRSYRSSVLANVGYQDWYYDPDEETAQTQRHTPEECAPPDLAREPFDLTSRWGELAGERYDAYLDGDGPHIFGDNAGAGKTTNAARGAAIRDRPHAVLFQQHKKAREFVRDDATPDDYYHLKGGAQARDDACMDADHADESCAAHPAGECPSMCPVYDLGSDHPIRSTYEALLAEVGPVKAHQILGDALPGHDEDGSCAWLEQFSEAARANRIAGVHEYQVLKTVQRIESGGGRDVIIDESPATLGDGRTVEVARLTRLANALDDVAGLSRSDKGLSKTLEELARFTRDVIDALTGGRDDDLGEIDPPAVYGGAREDDVAGHYLERLDLDGEAWQVAERLAGAKLEYNETIVNRMRNDRWEGAPLAVDALLAAGVAAGLPEAVRTAIAAPTTLGHCPRCGSALGHVNGARCCGSEDGCGWHEATDALLPRDAPRARAEAGLTGAGSDGAGLKYHALPLVDDLPDRPLVLDATATPAKVAAFYGYDEEDVVVSGDEPLQANLHVTQILDGQYHAGTLKESDTARERTQATIDTVGRVHDRPLFVVKKEFIQLFDFPEHAEVLHYHATRGLNREQCDAVVCIGAPHPRPDALRRDARLLAMGRDDVRVGGEEHSTRLEDGQLAANPPVYRKLLYEDDDGNGLAVPTRHYTGLMGELFREGREKELTQVIHRIRPLLADETKSAYLLTNVPTETPVDEVCSFSDLADPIRALLPVPDGAVQLLEAVRDVVEGDGPDGFRAETLVDLEGDRVTNNKRGFHRLAHLSGLDVTYQTVARWVNGLDDLGLLDPEGYVSREGERYSVSRATLTSALQVVSSNGGLQVAAKRLLRRKIADAVGGLGWLRWAREAFALSGDRCAWVHGGDLPPDAPG